MRGELVKLGFGKKLAEIDEHIGSDKHSLIKKLYEEKNYKNIIDYKLGDKYQNLNYIIKEPIFWILITSLINSAIYGYVYLNPELSKSPSCV